MRVKKLNLGPNIALFFEISPATLTYCLVLKKNLLKGLNDDSLEKCKNWPAYLMQLFEKSSILDTYLAIYIL